MAVRNPKVSQRRTLHEHSLACVDRLLDFVQKKEKEKEKEVEETAAIEDGTTGETKDEATANDDDNNDDNEDDNTATTSNDTTTLDDNGNERLIIDEDDNIPLSVPSRNIASESSGSDSKRSGSNSNTKSKDTKTAKAKKKGRSKRTLADDDDEEIINDTNNNDTTTALSATNDTNDANSGLDSDELAGYTAHEAIAADTTTNDDEILGELPVAEDVPETFMDDQPRHTQTNDIGLNYLLMISLLY